MESHNKTYTTSLKIQDRHAQYEDLQAQFYVLQKRMDDEEGRGESFV